MKKKLKLVVLTILAVSLFTGCTSIFKKDKQEEKAKEDYIPVEVEKVIVKGQDFLSNGSNVKVVRGDKK